jgi:hypothetical protein
MQTYIYYGRNDTNCEIIGRVMATSLNGARECIMQMKRLSAADVDELFVIKKV